MFLSHAPVFLVFNRALDNMARTSFVMGYGSGTGINPKVQRSLNTGISSTVAGTMRKVNLEDVEWQDRHSPKGKFGRRMKNISVALGREPESLDLAKRWPFDLALVSVPKG